MYNYFEVGFEKDDTNKYSILGEKVFDKQVFTSNLNFTMDEISEFLCKNETKKSFVTSPYTETVFDPKTKQRKYL